MSMFTNPHRSILSETAWVFAGQGVSALATLVGVRLITELVPPAVYGSVVLALGIIALAHGLAAGPLMQAVLRLFPDLVREGRERELRRATLRALRKRVLFAFALLAVTGAGWSLQRPEDTWLIALALALFVAEVARSVEITFLNAARRQREMALLTMADAWVRPFAAAALVWVFGASAAAVIGGYLAGCTLALAGYRLLAATSGKAVVPAASTSSNVAAVSDRLWMYAMPLMALPLIGWVSGQADRYFIGGLASVAEAGIYAALYGLVSKPFLMFSASAELALRQPFYARVTAADYTGARRVLTVWFIGVLVGALALCVLFMVFHATIAGLLLAADYRAHSALMGWIAVGHVLLSAAQVLERVCYACHDTRGVVSVEAAGALANVAIAAPLVWLYGIEGAAWAVPVSFGVQLALTAARARWVWRWQNGRETVAARSAAVAKIR